MIPAPFLDTYVLKPIMDKFEQIQHDTYTTHTMNQMANKTLKCWLFDNVNNMVIAVHVC